MSGNIKENDVDPLDGLYQLEDNMDSLNFEERVIIDGLFKGLDDLYEFQENINNIIMDGRITRTSIKDFFISLIDNEFLIEGDEKRGISKYKKRKSIIFRMFFELPELVKEAIQKDPSSRHLEED